MGGDRVDQHGGTTRTGTVEYHATTKFVTTSAVSKNADDVGEAAVTTGIPITEDPSESAGSLSSASSLKRRMSSSSLTKPIRRSYAGMVAGLASTVGLAQAMLLKATYESPPDARGPRTGVERPRIRGPFGNSQVALSSSAGHVTRVANPAVQATEEEAARIAQEMYPFKRPTSIKNRLVHGELDLQNDGAPVARKLLVIGDSLVSGVGGAASFSNTTPDGPALPRHVARFLSEMVASDVQWNALSLTGGDVRMLKKKVLPMLKRERERVGGDDPLFAAIVVVTGFNDMKRVSPVRTAKKFREDLDQFIDDIRQEVGAQVQVFLPSIPGVHHTPRFHEPLRSILIFLNNLWDAQKIALSRSKEGVHFVGNPPEAAWHPNPAIYFSSLDRIHPSELGYQHWGKRIAKCISDALNKVEEDAATNGTAGAAGGDGNGINAMGQDITDDADRKLSSLQIEE